MADPPLAAQPTPCRLLTLDGGGAKGFYTLGVLKEIEALIGTPLYQRFELVFGTSTGAIIAALVALGKTVNEIHALYKEHVPIVMRGRTKADKSAALKRLADIIFEPRQRNLWVTDAFEWRPEVRPRGRRRRIARTQLFVFLASWRWNQLALPGKRYAVLRVLSSGSPTCLARRFGLLSKHT
jgi:predicted acylesterase/phospholipase RssA